MREGGMGECLRARGGGGAQGGAGRRAERTAEAEESEALSRQRAEIATAHADLLIVEEQNNLRVRQAQLEALAGAPSRSRTPGVDLFRALRAETEDDILYEDEELDEDAALEAALVEDAVDEEEPTEEEPAEEVQKPTRARRSRAKKRTGEETDGADPA